MKLIWYIVSIFVICLILLNNPRSGNSGSFISQAKLLNATRSTQRGMLFLITINIVIFFLLTIYFVIKVQV
uniref:Probable protein-export membrane protein SecG n=1 Tax=Riquetophycus sp. TaxID=1897556 RepID=A0A1C9C7X8_9FLOR|nr:preprotein translocase subunit G [Riquetophycus sp.]